jgi:hypothetical protein
MMRRATAKLADHVTATIDAEYMAYFNSGTVALRDYCDSATGSDLSCGELDKLTAMVQRRLRFFATRFED